MKGAVLALFCAVALVSAEVNENGCPINPYVDILKPHPTCNKYYQCVQGELVERKCASDLSFNEEKQECDWAENVDCGGRLVTPESSEESGNDSSANGDSNESGNDSNNNGDSSSEENGNKSSSNESGNDSDNNNSNGNGNPSEAEEICSREGSNGVLVAHEDCSKFYKCAYGVPVALNCNPGLLYNPENEQCDWPENVNCEDRNQGGDGDNGNDNNSSNGDNDNNSGGNSSDGDSSNESDNDNGNDGNGNGNPDQTGDICAADDELVAHENCNQFYKCSEGVPVTFTCYSGLLFNDETKQCDWPENVDCERRGEDGEADKDGENNNGGGNSDPSQAPDICAREDSDSVLVAHENCNQYYICRDGVPVTRDCNPNLVFNPATDECDWPEKIDCGTRRTFSSLNKHMRWVK